MKANRNKTASGAAGSSQATPPAAKHPSLFAGQHRALRD